jgi:hypothetical protein
MAWHATPTIATRMDPTRVMSHQDDWLQLQSPKNHPRDFNVSAAVGFFYFLLTFVRKLTCYVDFSMAANDNNHQLEPPPNHNTTRGSGGRDETWAVTTKKRAVTTKKRAVITNDKE